MEKNGARNLAWKPSPKLQLRDYFGRSVTARMKTILSLNWRSGTCPLSFDVVDPWREKTGTFPMFACNVGRTVTRRVANGTGGIIIFTGHANLMAFA